MDKRKDTILASGEQTNHHHRADGVGVEVYGDGDERLMVAPHGAIVTHEEHGPHTIPAGEYDIKRVVEYDPFADEIRSVRD